MSEIDKLSAEELVSLWRKRYNILYRAELSTLYHRKRESFFALLDKWDKVFVLLLGSGAFINLISLEKHPAFAISFVVLSLASLVFDFSERSRKHGELATKFKLLEASIERTGERDWKEVDLNEWSAEIREIESGEPATYTLLVRLCQNEIANARGILGDVSKMRWYEILLAHFLPFSGRKIQFHQNS